LDQPVFPHDCVHGGRQDHRASRRQRQRGQEIVRRARRQLGDGVGGRRRDQEHVRGIGKRQVEDLLTGVERIVIDGMARQRLKREGPDKSLGGVGHHHGDIRAERDESPQERDGFVRGDAPVTPADCRPLSTPLA
jgi:hypothetical protein